MSWIFNFKNHFTEIFLSFFWIQLKNRYKTTPYAFSSLLLFWIEYNSCVAISHSNNVYSIESIILLFIADCWLLAALRNFTKCVMNFFFHSGLVRMISIETKFPQTSKRLIHWTGEKISNFFFINGIQFFFQIHIIIIYEIVSAFKSAKNLIWMVNVRPNTDESWSHSAQ